MDTFFIRKYPALKNKNFTRLLLSQFLSQTGGFIQNVALSVTINQKTDSRLMLGIFLCICYLPVFLLSYPAARFSQKNTKAVLVITECLLFSMSVLLCIFSDMPYPAFLVFGGVWGVIRAFQTPCAASVPRLVCDKKDTHSAVTLLSLAMSLGRALGPIISGLLCSLLDTRAAFIANAVSYIPSFILILKSRIPKMSVSKRKKAKPNLPVFLLIAVFVFSLLGTAYNIIFTGVMKSLELKEYWLSIFMACVGAGAIIGALILSGKKRAVYACLGISVCQFMTAIFKSPIIIGVIAWLYGLCDYLFFTSAISKLQAHNTPATVTRAMGVYTIVNTGALPLGFLALGFLTDFLGIGVTLLITSGISAMFYLCFFSKIR